FVEPPSSFRIDRSKTEFIVGPPEWPAPLQALIGRRWRRAEWTLGRSIFPRSVSRGCGSTSSHRRRALRAELGCDGSRGAHFRPDHGGLRVACHNPIRCVVSLAGVETGTMKRTFALILAALVAAALVGGLVHLLLLAAHLSEPAVATV